MSSTSPTQRKKCIPHIIPSPPVSMNGSIHSNNKSNHNNGNAAMCSHHYLQCGILMIVLTVVAIDGIALLSQSNVFGTNMFHRYLRTQQESPSSVTKSLVQQRGTTEGEDDEEFQTLSSSSIITNEPKIVWLMSFPNSGTSYTSQLVRDTTFTITASNYADETPLGLEGFIEPVYDDQIHGPFWIRPDDNSPIEYTEPTKYILTKTHCGMRCTLCPPEKYTESSYSFRRRCLTTKWVQEKDDGASSHYERIFGEYKPDRVVKAIHLIRNPFDNVVSRYHLDHSIEGRQASKYDLSRDGFRSYCQSIDSMYAMNEDRVTFLDVEILDIIRQVPCHEEFIRYVEWHNLAFSTADDLRLHKYVLHYEWYTTRFDTTVMEILNFLGFDKKIAEPVPFRPSVSYDYFTTDEKMALRHAYQMMSSSQTWAYISQYFDDVITTTTSATATSTI